MAINWSIVAIVAPNRHLSRTNVIMNKNTRDFAPFPLLCLTGFATFFSAYLRIPVLPLFAATLGAGPAQVGMALTYTAIGALIVELTPAVQRGLAMGMYNSCIYLGMMAGAAAMGVALGRIGYSIGFAVAGGAVLATLLLFLVMMREQRLRTHG